MVDNTILYNFKMRPILIVFLCFLLTADTAEEWIVNLGIGKAYRLIYEGQTWFNARSKCEKDEAKLAVPTSKKDFDFMQQMVHALYHPNVTNSDTTLFAWLGINNLGHYKTWMTIDRVKLEDSGFSTWVVGNGDSFSDNPKEPHCAGLGPTHFGLRQFWCHLRAPYLCQRTVG